MKFFMSLVARILWSLTRFPPTSLPGDEKKRDPGNEVGFPQHEATS